MTDRLPQLFDEITAEAHRILQWWRSHAPDVDRGGFYGEIDHDNLPNRNADKGCVLHARILWSFSAAYRAFGIPEDLHLARKAFEYITTHFYDRDQGGVYWALKANGEVSKDRKQIYAQAFTIYGLSEYYKITGDAKALDPAIDLYHAVEYHSQDPDFGGYYEAYSKDWYLLEDLRLSEKDRNDPKTMNTHLHLIEAYANLYQVWREPRLKESILRLLYVFDTRIIQANHHLGLFFDKGWNNTSSTISYGHDIEASWLLPECAEVLHDPELIKQWNTKAVDIAVAAAEGLQSDGSLIHESNPEAQHTDSHREWWVSAEGMVGFLHVYHLTKDPQHLDHVYRLWEFIKTHLLDMDRGEWYWGTYADYTKMPEYKMGFWKCPYHNLRACLEVMKRIEWLREGS